MGITKTKNPKASSGVKPGTRGGKGIRTINMTGGKADQRLSLYSDRGSLIQEDVSLSMLHPANNSAIRLIAQTIINSAMVDLAGIESILRKGHLGGEHCEIRGREIDLELVKNAKGLAARTREILRINENDDSNVEVLEGGKILLVHAPSHLSQVFCSHDGVRMAAAMALGHAIVEEFGLPFWQVPTLKAALIGRYSSSVDLLGGKVHHLLKESTVLEGPGHAFRTIPVNHFAAITEKNAMNAAALAGTTELLGHLESGDCYGPFEPYTLLAYAFQSLNANNLVYTLVRDNRKGTVSDVANDLIERASKDGVIARKKILPSGYKLYCMRNPSLWNAYACAGTLAAVMVNVGASRAAQMATSTMAYFNDALELRTGLPSADADKLHGIGVVWSFYSHSIYGGGGPGIFSGDNPIIRNSFGGFMIPCGAAAMALDAGTQMFTPERTSSIVGKVFGRYPFMKEPIKHIADSIGKVRGE